MFKYVLISFLVFIFATYALFLFYCAMMNIEGARKKNPGLPLLFNILTYPIELIGIILDVVYNVVTTLIFLDFPREFTLSMRLERYLKTEKGFRFKIAKLIEPVLDPLDPSGDHI
jgi:hypothetical protein